MALIGQEAIEDLKFKDFSNVKGDYFGQKPPGLQPEVFAPGIISDNGVRVINSVFTSDGKHFFFNSGIKRGTPEFKYVLLHTWQVNGVWQKPVVPHFAGVHSDVDPSLSLDGTKLFFWSDRNIKSDKGKNLFFCQRYGDKWSKPELVNFPISHEEIRSAPLYIKDGSLFMASSRPGGYTEVDMYFFRKIGDKFAEPVNLGKMLNTEFNASEVVVNPGGDFMIFNIGKRPDTIGIGDLYLSFKKPDSTWTEFVHMGPEFNVPKAANFCPAVSPDGKYIFFTRALPESCNIYWVSVEVVEKFRSDYFNTNK